MKISKHSAEHYRWGDGCDGWHLVKKEDLSVIHECMPPGTEEVRHVHHRARQFFFVLSGKLAVEVDGNVVELLPHEGVEIDQGVPHQVKNVSESDAEFLVISQPSSRGDRTPAE
jgi:mannose-6-phosphate isomerase-like protein (cupin superfamily)